MLKGLFKSKLGQQNFVTVVSGLPRSGTSMMMQVLSASGIEILSDETRGPDNHNIKGYYELERVMQLPKQDTTWLYDAQGKAIKVISHLLKHLPLGYEYRVIFMCRNLDEVIASQKQMLIGLGREKEVAQLENHYQQHLEAIKSWIEAQEHLKVNYLNYSDFVAYPEENVKTVSDFLGLKLPVNKMVEVVDPRLKHQ